MRGHIRQRSAGSYSLVIELERDAAGKRRQKWVTVRGTRKDALAKLSELQVEADRGKLQPEDKLTVAGHLNEWLENVVAVHNRPRTREAYASVVRLHLIPHLGRLPLSKLRPRHVKDMEAAMLRGGMGKSIIRKAHAVLGRAMQVALEDELPGVDRNPVLAVRPPALDPPSGKFPDISAIVAILAKAKGTEYEPILTFAAMTGVRRGEAMALRWAATDLERASATILESAQRLEGKGICFLPPKSAAGRRNIALDPSTVAMLKQHRAQQAERRLLLGTAWQDKDLVFAGPTGGGWSARWSVSWQRTEVLRRQARH
ncbi:MAG: tyrosine-type recombinase/integrase family protein [Chloroflexi bacterium]|nr:tyrosine-type recombinase/integrase family protein [Chloroflexota bacterium]